MPSLPGRESDAGPDCRTREMSLWELIDEARESLHSAERKALGARDKNVDGHIRQLFSDVRGLLDRAEKELL